MSTETPTLTCSSCGSSLSVSQVVNIKGKRKSDPTMVLCTNCADQAEQAFQAETEDTNFLGAVLLGLLAAVVSALIWYGIVVVTDYQLGIIAVAIGWLVAQGVIFGAGRKRGSYLQAISVIITRATRDHTQPPTVNALWPTSLLTDLLDRPLWVCVGFSMGRHASTGDSFWYGFLHNKGVLRPVVEPYPGCETEAQMFVKFLCDHVSESDFDQKAFASAGRFTRFHQTRSDTPPPVDWVNGKRDHVAIGLKDNITNDVLDFLKNQKSVGGNMVVVPEDLGCIGGFWEGLGLNPENLIQIPAFESPNHCRVMPHVFDSFRLPQPSPSRPILNPVSRVYTRSVKPREDSCSRWSGRDVVVLPPFSTEFLLESHVTSLDVV